MSSYRSKTIRTLINDNRVGIDRPMLNHCIQVFNNVTFMEMTELAQDRSACKAVFGLRTRLRNFTDHQEEL